MTHPLNQVLASKPKRHVKPPVTSPDAAPKVHKPAKPATVAPSRKPETRWLEESVSV